MLGLAYFSQTFCSISSLYWDLLAGEERMMVSGLLDLLPEKKKEKTDQMFFCAQLRAVVQFCLSAFFDKRQPLLSSSNSNFKKRQHCSSCHFSTYVVQRYFVWCAKFGERFVFMPIISSTLNSLFSR